MFPWALMPSKHTGLRRVHQAVRRGRLARVPAEPRLKTAPSAVAADGRMITRFSPGKAYAVRTVASRPVTAPRAGRGIRSGRLYPGLHRFDQETQQHAFDWLAKTWSEGWRWSKRKSRVKRSAKKQVSALERPRRRAWVRPMRVRAWGS
jgi:hypothetical protein